MNTSLNKIAAGLAAAIGGMAVFAGGRVLLGADPGYYVINWLLLYNYSVGLATVLLTVALLWRNSRLARPAALATFGLHAGVMLILLIAYREVVAVESLAAMTLRVGTWAAILALMAAQARRARAAGQTRQDAA